MMQNFFMVYFLGVPLDGRIVLHTFKWQNLQYKKLLVPPSGRLISIRWNGSKNYKILEKSLFHTGVPKLSVSSSSPSINPTFVNTNLNNQATYRLF
jgi:hypothetical protein